MSNQLPTNTNHIWQERDSLRVHHVIVFFAANDSRIAWTGLFSTAPAPRIPRAGLLWLQKIIELEQTCSVIFF
jgi:hypothetical protein